MPLNTMFGGQLMPGRFPAGQYPRAGGGGYNPNQQVGGGSVAVPQQPNPSQTITAMPGRTGPDYQPMPPMSAGTGMYNTQTDLSGGSYNPPAQTTMGPMSPLQTMPMPLTPSGANTGDIQFQNQMRQTMMDSPLYNPNGANTWAIQNGTGTDLQAVMRNMGQGGTQPTGSPALGPMGIGNFGPPAPGSPPGAGQRYAVGPYTGAHRNPNYNPQAAQQRIAQRDQWTQNMKQSVASSWGQANAADKAMMLRNPNVYGALVNDPQFAASLGFTDPTQVRQAVNSLLAGNLGGGGGMYDTSSPWFSQWGGTSGTTPSMNLNFLQGPNANRSPLGFPALRNLMAG